MVFRMNYTTRYSTCSDTAGVERSLFFVHYTMPSTGANIGHIRTTQKTAVDAVARLLTVHPEARVVSVFSAN